jgi:hypothetical protein
MGITPHPSSARHIKEAHLLPMYRHWQGLVCDQVNELQFMGLQFDCWSAGSAPGSGSGRTFLGITGSAITSDWKRVKIPLGLHRVVGFKGAKTVADTLVSALEDFGVTPNRVAGLSTDNCATECKAASDTVGPANHIRCHAHLLHLAVCDALGMEKDVSGTECLVCAKCVLFVPSLFVC